MYYSTSIYSIVNDFPNNTNFEAFKYYIYNYINSNDSSFDTSTK